jgi:hypothetical protein
MKQEKEEKISPVTLLLAWPCLCYYIAVNGIFQTIYFIVVSVTIFCITTVLFLIIKDLIKTKKPDQVK